MNPYTNYLVKLKDKSSLNLTSKLPEDKFIKKIFTDGFFKVYNEDNGSWIVMNTDIVAMVQLNINDGKAARH